MGGLDNLTLSIFSHSFAGELCIKVTAGIFGKKVKFKMLNDREFGTIFINKFQIMQL
jgi:hypothetical protein